MPYHHSDPIIRYTPSFLPFTLFFHLMMCLVRLIDWLGFGLRIEGREHLKGLDSGIVVSNHTLLMDPAVIAHAIRPRRSYFTMLEETATIPFLGTFVRLLGGIPIPQSPGSMRMLERSLSEALSAVGFVHFFPEGELYRWSQEVRPFRPGAFALALRLNVSVVPLAIVLRERRLWGRRAIRILGRTIRVPPRVTVVVCSPVFPESARLSEFGEGAESSALQHASGQGADSSAGLKRAAQALGRVARERMQAAIDERGGSRSLYRGQMPRLTRSGRTNRAPIGPSAAIPTTR